ncbi:S1 RNA-binding domain-containing protein 1-like [Physella acuta]|uniref:S1 RNA-binding domain-containing protein 1-like n=1 Tax=Physella acuta TaxID=109671 RepID=UPI0027DB5499|nr:S1 RNA-binding domain-containing protein 1-like [Physella acuta]XP_059162178.1 S1 RNA-binding domain-containing protein 1-like [Physella acuta]
MEELNESGVNLAWETHQVIANKLKLRPNHVFNVVSLLEDGATIPFIARYRKDQTGDMGPDLLREVATNVEELKSVESKIQTVYATIEKMGKMTGELETSLKLSTTILEVETLYAPFKPGHKGTYAERARALGLEAVARSVLNNRKMNLGSLINIKEKGLESVGEIEKGIQHIIADIVSKDKECVDEARNICDKCQVMIETTKSKPKATKVKKTSTDSTQTMAKVKLKGKNEESAQKFEQYQDFKCWVKSAKPHQILAINRGEDLKALSVKISIPDRAKAQFMNFAVGKYLKNISDPENITMIRQAVLDAYDRLIEPMLCRQIRSDLTKDAEKASISVFTSNLKRLLLTPPIKGKTILGVDPGFRNGCKVAVISPTGQVMKTDVIYLHDFNSNKQTEINRVVEIVQSFKCEIITIGNGVGCRETEQIISSIIKQQNLKPFSIVYCIVDECGASIYSISDEAKKEFPDLDPTLRGAVSIARRLQDPLAELVKIEPKHLGVGMYQHDINKTKLQNALSSVVEECVSFVGVDLNTCSECLLKRVAGLNATKAKKLLEWRAKNGQFTNRQQLLSIKGLGAKGFEQCAGFVRVNPPNKTAINSVDTGDCKEEQESDSVKGRKRKTQSSATGSKSKKRKTAENDEWNPLDATSIHPESYNIAQMLATFLNVNLEEIGKESFMNKVKRDATESSLSSFCEKNNVGLATIKQIADALKQPLTYDFRESFQRPLFKQEVQSVSDLRSGSELTGRVTNVTHFGAFVDIGVGINGLIHCSKMGRCGKVGVGDHVEVQVESIDLDRRRIGLLLKDVKQV